MIKVIHMTLAFMSVTGFVMRFVWRFTYPAMLKEKFVRVAPHVVDTFLLLFGLWLLLEYTGASYGWLIAKVATLFIYIGMGVLALRAQGPLCYAGFAGALLAVLYIFSVAFSRSVVPF
ncbi:MAG: SirB2 family protein [Pseudomonadota bacterium]